MLTIPTQRIIYLLTASAVLSCGADAFKFSCFDIVSVYSYKRNNATQQTFGGIHFTKSIAIKEKYICAAFLLVQINLNGIRYQVWGVPLTKIKIRVTREFVCRHCARDSDLVNTRAYTLAETWTMQMLENAKSLARTCGVKDHAPFFPSRFLRLYPLHLIALPKKVRGA